jgi:hypothetical protein
MVNIDAMQDLYVSKRASKQLQRANLPSPDVQGPIQGAHVSRLRRDDKADNGRQRFLLLLTENGRNDDAQVVREKLEDRAEALFDKLMAATTKTEVSNEIRRVYSICEELDAELNNLNTKQSGSTGTKASVQNTRDKRIRTQISDGGGDTDETSSGSGDGPRLTVQIASKLDDEALQNDASKTKASKPAGSAWLSVTALVASVLAVGISGYTWNLIGKVDRGLGMLEGSSQELNLEQRITLLDAETESQQAIVDQLSSSLESSKDDGERLAAQTGELDETIQALKLDLTQLDITTLDEEKAETQAALAMLTQSLGALTRNVDVQMTRASSVERDLATIQQLLTETDILALEGQLSTLRTSLDNIRTSLIGFEVLRSAVEDRLGAAVTDFEGVSNAATSLANSAKETEEGLLAFGSDQEAIRTRLESVNLFLSTLEDQTLAISSTSLELSRFLDDRDPSEGLTNVQEQRMILLVGEIISQTEQLYQLSERPVLPVASGATHSVSASNGVRIRDRPVNGKILAVLANETELKFIENDQGQRWAKFAVLNGDNLGIDGWISLGFVTEIVQ